MISIFVTINIKDGFRDQFVEAVLDDARGSVRDEAGCYRFDVLQDSENPNPACVKYPLMRSASRIRSSITSSEEAMLR